MVAALFFGAHRRRRDDKQGQTRQQARLASFQGAALPSRPHADFFAGCDAAEVPCAGCTEAAGSAERVLHELDVADLVARHLGEQPEGRGNLLAERTRFVRKAPEHRDTVFVHDYVSDLERLCLPHSADAAEDIDDALWAAVRSRPG